jgi:hypothetical protein
VGEVLLSFVFLLLSLFLAAAGAALGAWWQHKSWMSQHWQEQREERIKLATETVERAAQLIDQRLFRERQLLWAVRSQNALILQDALIEYRKAVAVWMENLGKSKAELWTSFDKWTALSFELQIHDPLASIGRKIEAAINGKIPTTLYEEEKNLNKFGRSSYEYIQRLMDRIKREDLSGLTGRNQLTYENWTNLTSGYLIMRLFGLASE